MATWKITNRQSGMELGTYEGATAADALDAMARDAGYADYAASCAVAAGDDATPEELARVAAELEVGEVEETD